MRICLLVIVIGAVVCVHACVSLPEFSDATFEHLKVVPLAGFFVAEEKDSYYRDGSSFSLPTSYILHENGIISQRPFDKADPRLIKWESITRLPLEIDGLDLRRVIKVLCAGDGFKVYVSHLNSGLVFFAQDSHELSLYLCNSMNVDIRRHDERMREKERKAIQEWITLHPDKPYPVYLSKSC